MRIGYARVSTENQVLTPQIDALTNAGCTRIFSDHGVSGAAASRAGIDEALAALKEDDVLVVMRLDRLGRSMRYLLEFVEGLSARGIGFISLTEGFDTTTNTGRLVFHILGAIAEFERGLISERTRSGLASARREGRIPGRRHRLSHADVAEAHRQMREDRRHISQIARDLDVHRDTLRRALRR